MFGLIALGCAAVGIALAFGACRACVLAHRLASSESSAALRLLSRVSSTERCSAWGMCLSQLGITTCIEITDAVLPIGSAVLVAFEVAAAVTVTSSAISIRDREFILIGIVAIIAFNATSGFLLAITRVLALDVGVLLGGRKSHLEGTLDPDLISMLADQQEPFLEPPSGSNRASCSASLAHMERSVSFDAEQRLSVGSLSQAEVLPPPPTKVLGQRNSSGNTVTAHELSVASSLQNVPPFSL